jgi:hypothetical protein
LKQTEGGKVERKKVTREKRICPEVKEGIVEKMQRNLFFSFL